MRPLRHEAVFRGILVNERLDPKQVVGENNSEMFKIIRAFARRLLLMVLPDSDHLRFLAYKPAFETWRKRQTGTHPIFAKREQMYDFINRDIIGPREIVFLEFGVYKGESILYFAGIHPNPESRFVGFDTFEGLPEDWTEFSRTLKSRTFSTDGTTPQTNDARVSFVKGLFQETLSTYLSRHQPGRQLVIHNDSDLYSSTLFLLTHANHIITPGTIIMFDEFYSPLHEFRALQDYCSSYLRDYEVITATEGHGKVAIRMR